ncbi:MAG: glycosyltransferase family 4 protein [Candidatus Omnitrophica bacterium]|nr:glycosyltransferase family 4 protein [Candidatus Omnitrophota bacterium]
MEKKKTFIYSHDFPPIAGGGATYSYNLARQLSSLGHEIVVLAPRSRNKNCRDIDDKAGFRIVRMPNRDKSTIKNILWGIPYFIYVLFKFRPEMVILIDMESQFVASIIRKVYKFDYIVTVHEASIISNIFSRKNKVKISLLKNLYGKAHYVLVVSNYLKGIIEKLGLRESEKIEVISIGIDRDQFSIFEDSKKLRNSIARDDQKILLTVARLEPRKGVDRLIKALPKIIDKVPNVKYLIVGDGEDKVRLKTLVNNYSLQDYVQFTGYVSNEEIIKYYDLSDVVVFPSVLQDGKGEGLGLVLCEAGARGKPIIAGNCGGVPEIIKDNETGLLVNPENTEELAQKAVQLLMDKELSARLGKNAREKVFSGFTWDKISQQISELISYAQVSGRSPETYKKPRILFLLSNLIGNKIYSEKIYDIASSLDSIDKDFLFIEPRDYQEIPMPKIIRASGSLMIAWITKKKFLKKYKNFPFDGVISSTWEPLMGLWKWCKNKPKVVVTDVSPMDFIKLHANHFSARGEWGVRNTYKHFIKLNLMHYIYKKILKKVDYFYAWSQWCAEGLGKYYNINPSQIEVLPCPIDTLKWQPNGKKTDNLLPTILFVGDFHRKNGKFLVDVCTKYLKGMCRLKIITGNDMSKTKLPTDVQLINGWLGKDDVLREFQDSDLFAMPSTREAFSIAIRQAASVGLPVLATDIYSGVRDIVRDGINGYRLPFGKEEVWAEKIKSLLENKNLREEMGKNSRKLALEQMGIEAFNLKIKEAVAKISNLEKL